MVVDRNKYKDLLVIVVGFCLIGLLISRGYDKPYGVYFIYSALAIGVIGIFSERAATWVTAAWQHFGKLLGKINSTILIGVVFLLLLTPMAILKRLTTKRNSGENHTTWEDSDSRPVNFEKLW